MRATAALLLVALAVALAPTPVTHAGPISPGLCATPPEGEPARTWEIVVDETTPLVYYVQERSDSGSLYVYAESNGLYHGGDACGDLQYGGCSPFVPDDCERCTTSARVTCSLTPDQLLY